MSYHDVDTKDEADKILAERVAAGYLGYVLCLNATWYQVRSW